VTASEEIPMLPESHDTISTTEKEARAKRTLIFGGLFARLFGREEAVSARGLDAPASSSASLEQLEVELKEMTDRADARLREPDSVRGEASRLGAGPAETGNRERLLEQRGVARQAMERDIARLHDQLATGIDRGDMERLHRLLQAHAPDPEEPLRASIEERIERSVLMHLFLRAAQEAWHRFEGLIERSGLVWPVQEGLPETAAPEELDRLRERHREEIRAAFLGTSLQQVADVIRGDVKAWVWSYPDKHSYLWLQTALRGVAAALCAQFFAASVELWMWRTMELERRLLAAVDEELKTPRLLLRNGIRSFSEAVELASRVDHVCETVIPALVWSHVAPKLEWVRTGKAPSPISVLAAGLSQIDPVCGMSLTADRVAARLESPERLLYFCSPSCLQRFEATPQKFSPGAVSTATPQRHDSAAPRADKGKPS
jgi:YHS domain-containing protein